jgi:predicted DNA-binding protein (UPF0251 family)
MPSSLALFAWCWPLLTLLSKEFKRMNKYYLTIDEQKNLRIVCYYAGLSFSAMAARPKIAKAMIKAHLTAAKEAIKS